MWKIKPVVCLTRQRLGEATLDLGRGWLIKLTRNHCLITLWRMLCLEKGYFRDCMTLQCKMCVAQDTGHEMPGNSQSDHNPCHLFHYDDVIMAAIASLITSLTIVYSTVYSDVDQRKHQSSASLAFVWGIHRRPVNSPQKWQVTRKMFPFDDVIMFACDYVTTLQKDHIDPL